MYLDKIRIRNFRCLESVDLEPGSGINWIIGENASGKSSLLEAIYFLSRARSFRRTSQKRLLRNGAEQLSVYGRQYKHEYESTGIGIAWQNGQTHIKIGQMQSLSFYDLASALPVQVIDPGLHRLLEEGPSERRRYMDWGVFHVEHAFFMAWRRYRRALKQRNSALKAGYGVDHIRVWDSELLDSAHTVHGCRQSYVERLAQLVPSMIEEVLGEGAITLDYSPGWSRDKTLLQALSDSLESDRYAGFTHVGPHRADLKLKFGSAHARDWVSRGQQKVLTSALLIAQTALHTRETNTDPIVLIDDMAAELGGTYQDTLINLLRSVGVQCFITALSPDSVSPMTQEEHMFHVEHGSICHDYVDS